MKRLLYIHVFIINSISSVGDAMLNAHQLIVKFHVIVNADCLYNVTGVTIMCNDGVTIMCNDGVTIMCNDGVTIMCN